MEFLFKEYYRPLVLWADTFLNDTCYAEDLVQEFFVKLWEKKLCETLEPKTLKSYLFTAIKNLSLNVLDKQDPLKKAYTLSIIDPVNLEYDDLDERMLHHVEAQIAQLPPRSRDVLISVYLKGMKYKEVAATYDISIATVKTLLVNALKKLRNDSNNIVNVLLLFFIKKCTCRFNRF